MMTHIQVSCTKFLIRVSCTRNLDCLSGALYHLFCLCDLDLDPVNFIYELDVHFLKIYLLAKNELSRSRLVKVRAQTEETGATEHITSCIHG